MDKSASLTPNELRILKHQDTEPAHSGKYNSSIGLGTYLCRQCGLALFRADSKFISSCGWPSFDIEILNSVKRKIDQDGVRTEIICQRCGAHLGHVFMGEQLTKANTRHCVNSLSMDFVSDPDILDTEEAIYAGGCFWGVQHLLKSLDGVLATVVGYTGGRIDDPSYVQVCSGNTGHFEAVRVIYDNSKLTFETLTKIFLEIHDPYQQNGQGFDIGSQYKSAIFCYDEQQKQTAKELLNILKQEKKMPMTVLLPVSAFWSAEDEHQDYYAKHQNNNICHTRVSRFK